MKAASLKKYPIRYEVFLKPSYLILTSTATLFAAAVLAAAQTPATPPSAALPPAKARVYPAPTNLKVLPNDLTGKQVHEIMEMWSASLGTHCDSCHTADPQNIGPNGRPRLNFADDSKEMKLAARVMYTMTEKINVDYVAKVDSSGTPVTCGTCHRGHIGPEPFKVQSPDSPPTTQLPTGGEARPPAR
jgi:cytochrome c553